MEFGCMGLTSRAMAIKVAGFDRMELDLREIMTMDDEEFLSVLKQLGSVGLTYHVCSWILPVDLDITAPDFDKSSQYDYLSAGADRCAALGVRVWPFGTGKGRSIKPQNGDAHSQAERATEFIAYVDEIASRRGILTAIEPLGPANSNYISTLAQADEVRARIGSETIKLMCDLRHMVGSHDSFDSIDVYAERIIHCHIDYPLGRRRVFPANGDGFDYRPYLDKVGRLECSSLAFEAIDSENTPVQMRAALKYVRTLMQG